MFNFEKSFIFNEKDFDLFTMGELIVDMISDDYEGYTKHFGGSPANIAMNVKKLGGNSVIAASVGKDSFGDYLISCLNKRNINTNYINQVDKATSMVVVTKSKDTPVPIFYRDADYDLQYNEDINYILENTKILHFSSWPLSQHKSRKTMEKVLEEGRKNNIEYIKNIIKKVDIIKPSEVDAERLFGEDSPENQVKKFVDLGAKLVIMTLGKDGAIVTNGKETLKFETLAKEIVDTTGAGDAFWSGFYTGITKGYTLKKSLELGFATSAYKLRYTGAIAHLPKIEEIKNIYNL